MDAPSNRAILAYIYTNWRWKSNIRWYIYYFGKIY